MADDSSLVPDGGSSDGDAAGETNATSDPGDAAGETNATSAGSERGERVAAAGVTTGAGDGTASPSASWLAGRSRAAAVVVALTAAAVSWTVATQLFPHHSLNHDEGVYLTQAAMLLEGRLTIRPPVAETFRPWFFIRQPDGSLYPKYAPVPAATFALGKLAGSARLALAATAAGVCWLTYAVGAATFDRRRGVLAAVLLVVSPMFLLQSGVFLPYMPTALWNLAFAVAYFRADRLARTGNGRRPDPTERAERRDAAGWPDRVGPTRWLDRRGPTAWAGATGVAVGVAFFSRPYTAVLFAAPFVVHALTTLVVVDGRSTGAGGDPGGRLPAWFDERAVRRQAVTALLGLAGVAVALGYNAVLTGSPTRFPYQAFAPADGIGFGRREILGYSRLYTSELAVRANARVVTELFGRWVAGGPAGTALAAVGLFALGRRLVPLLRDSPPTDGADDARTSDESGDDATGHSEMTSSRAGSSETVRRLDERAVTVRRVVLAATFLTVIGGNVAFWGNLNLLGTFGARDGLIAPLGPYYHFDLLAVTAVFAADGAVRIAGRVRAWVATRRVTATDAPDDADVRRETAGTDVPRGPSGATDRAVGVGRAMLLALVVLGVIVPSAALAADPVSRNADVTRTYESAYAVAPPSDAVVFLPTPLGDWLTHPYQEFRNDPTFDEGPVYALPERQFAVSEAFPDRRSFRYVYRGEWAPLSGQPVTPHLQRVHVRDGRSVRLAVTARIPAATDAVSVRVAGDDTDSVADGDDTDAAAYAVDRPVAGDRLSLRLTVRTVENDTAVVRLAGPLAPVSGDEFRLTGTTEIRLRVFADYGTGAGLTYRVVFPVRVTDGRVTALTPELEACERPQLCGGEAAFVPGDSPGRIAVSLAGDARNASGSTDGTPAAVNGTAPTFAAGVIRGVGQSSPSIGPGKPAVAGPPRRCRDRRRPRGRCRTAGDDGQSSPHRPVRPQKQRVRSRRVTDRDTPLTDGTDSTGRDANGGPRAAWWVSSRQIRRLSAGSDDRRERRPTRER